MLKYVLMVVLVTPSFAFGKRKHAAHEHGVVKMDVIADGNKAVVMLKAPADSIFGFEHEAKSEEHKKQKEAALEVLRTKVVEALGVDPALACKIDHADVEHGKAHEHEEHAKKGHATKEHEVHSDVVASFKLSCAKPLAGAVWSIDLKKFFPRIQTIELQGKRVSTFPAKITL